LLVSSQAQGPFLAASVLFLARTGSPPAEQKLAAQPGPVAAHAPLQLPAGGPPALPPSGQPRQATTSAEDSTAWVLALVIFGGVLGTVGWVVYAMRKGTASGVRIRIIATPPGEAPEEVRRAWVGVELPLARGAAEPRHWNVVGAVSNRAPTATVGYLVEG